MDQLRDGGAQVSFGRVPEGLDQRVALQYRLHDAALYALPAAVDQADLAEPRLVRRAKILIDDRGDVARVERVQVYGVLDGKATRHGKW